ncbi:MAG TPA: potassium-transporting ATPase subunit KdpC [Acidobacteriota bacterium]|nr:potassium-transporting ATPase subunit KdpC [Acidobacteriota bacterium]
MLKQTAPALRIMLALTVLTGLAYPGIVTGLCQWLFPRQANGSLIFRDGRIAGSLLIGQTFSGPEYFHPRPSAAGPDGYDAFASGGSNLGPTSRELTERVKKDIQSFRRENPEYSGPLPADLATSSGSGLDPHISPASALAQSARVAGARGLTTRRVREFIGRYTEDPLLGFLGDPRVNVLRLNLALDADFPHGGAVSSAP